MPTVTDTILSPYDATSTLRQNIVEAIDAIDPRDTPLLAAKGWPEGAGAARGADSLSKPCIQQSYTWQSDELIPVATTLRAAYAAAAGVLQVATGTADYFRVGEILVIVSGTNATTFRVTARDLTNDNLTVTVENGDAAHANASTVTSLGIPRTLGEQYPTTQLATTIASDTNYTQIFLDNIAVTGTERASESVGLANRLDYESNKKLQELVIRLETACHYQPRSSALPTAVTQTPVRMGGLHYYIVDIDTTGNYLDGVGASLATNEDLLKDLLDAIWSDGGYPDTLLVNSFQRRAISSFLAPYVRTERDEGVAGVVVGKYEYSHGVLNVLLDRYVAQSHLWALSMDRIGIGPLKGNGFDRSFAWEEQPKTGDYFGRVILGEYTLECRSRARAHGLLRNLATS